jgi:hypothetical protein
MILVVLVYVGVREPAFALVDFFHHPLHKLGLLAEPPVPNVGLPPLDV